jgi:hypothetical protein
MQQLSVYEKNLLFLNYGTDPTPIPKEHSFLKKYFKTKTQKQFLNYYYVFRDKTFFQEHTGYKATTSFLHKMAGKFDWLMQEYLEAKKNLDLDKLSRIQGKKINIIKKLR